MKTTFTLCALLFALCSPAQQMQWELTKGNPAEADYYRVYITSNNVPVTNYVVGLSTNVPVPVLPAGQYEAWVTVRPRNKSLTNASGVISTNFGVEAAPSNVIGLNVPDPAHVWWMVQQTSTNLVQFTDGDATGWMLANHTNLSRGFTRAKIVDTIPPVVPQ